MAGDGGSGQSRPSLQAQTTFADLFLKGYSDDVAAEQVGSEADDLLQQGAMRKALSQSHYYKTIPDPPGWQKSFSSSTFVPAARQEEQPSGSEDLIDWGKRQQESHSKFLLQTMVQDYWKEQVVQPQVGSACPLVEESTAWQTPFLIDCGCLARSSNEGEKYRPYVVMVLQPVGLRRSPTLDVDEQCGNVLRPGECFVSSSRVSAEGTRFMRLMRGNWVFEFMNGERVLASLDELESGPWWYRNICSQLVEVRRVPTQGNWARSGYIICPNEACVVTLRCRVDGNRYLLLADGRGWIFEKSPLNSSSVEDEEVVMAECDVPPPRAPPPELALVGDKLAKPPPAMVQALQTGAWVYRILNQRVLALGTRLTGLVLEPGEQIIVNARISASGKKTAEVGVGFRRWTRKGNPLCSSSEVRVDSWSPTFRSRATRTHWRPLTIGE